MPGREEQFLEKIVQVSVDLADVSESGVVDYTAALVNGSSLADLLRPGEEGGPLEALAAVLKSNHPRHVKRLLNDLAMTLAILRNAGHLGEGDGRLPEVAVLAWHLLHEALPPGEWEEIRALRSNLEGFLRRWQSLAELREGERERAGISDEVLQLHEAGRLLTPVCHLAALTADQLDRLVHFGSPPRQERRAVAAAPDQDDLARLDSPGWVSLPGGTFLMGVEDMEDARPVHGVTLAPFKIARFPVTNAQHRRFLEGTGRGAPAHWPEGKIPAGKESHPVVHVSWLDAQAFCTWLGQNMAADGDGAVSLPTEAQWEFAARGHKGRSYPWGDEVPTAEHANFENRIGDTTPVGSFPKGATPMGVHELAGNVWEWCHDWYGPYGGIEECDPTGPSGGKKRILRGGSFSIRAEFLRTSYRNYDLPEYGVDRVGFRVVWSPSRGPE
jgi:formylglycine-generating enzyme required for sulfatase activity